MDLQPIVQWVAPIVSTALTTYVVALINRGEKNRTDWREGVNRRLDAQDEKIGAVLRGQTTQMRSDLVHKAHRYIDDLGCASMEEKDAFHAEYKDYCEICRQHKIENSFVDMLAQQVMALPDRPK